MADRARQIEREALGLEPAERARLAQRLIVSLDDSSDPDVERLWLEEAERRLDELLAGTAVARPADDVMRRARAALR